MMTAFLRFLGLRGVAALPLLLGMIIPGTSFADSSHESKSNKDPLIVFAAASLTDVLPLVGAAWKNHGGEEITFSFDASSRLANQIRNGAPADLYFSADNDWMNVLEKAGLLFPRSRRSLLQNQLVLAVPFDSKLQARPAIEIDFSSISKIAIAGENVPAGKYGEASLKALKKWDLVQAKLVRGDNVRTVLKWIATANVPVGIVYRTDALSMPQNVRVLSILPESTHPAIVYPAAIMKNTKNEASAQSFLNFCKSGEAKAIFDKFGFKLGESN